MSARIKYKHLKSQVQNLESMMGEFANRDQETINALTKLVKFLEEDRDRLKSEVAQLTQNKINEDETSLVVADEAEQEEHEEIQALATPELPKALEVVKSTPPRIKKIPKQNKSTLPPSKPKTNAGKYFEVSNAPIWKIKYVQGEVEDNLRFSQIKNKITKGQLSEEVLLKKPGTQWKRLKDIFEFNADVFAKKVDGEFKLLVRRENIRVPISENVNILGLGVSALCSDISYGGCYLESYELKRSMLHIGDEINFEFNSKQDERLQIKAVIRNLNEGLPIGIGLKFISMDQKTKEKLGEIFKVFVSKLNDVA